MPVSASVVIAPKPAFPKLYRECYRDEGPARMFQKYAGWHDSFSSFTLRAESLEEHRQWRVTSPQGRDMLSNNRSISFAALELSPSALPQGATVGLTHNIWEVKPSNPTDNIPDGFVSIQISFQGTLEALTGRLYLQTGESFHEQGFLSLSSDPGQCVMVRCGQLPSAVRRLALVLYAGSSEIVVKEFRMRRVGAMRRSLARASAIATNHLNHPQLLASKLRKGVRLMQAGGFAGIRDLLRTDARYHDWIRAYDTIDQADRQGMKRYLETATYKPLISILLPVHNAPESFLRKAIESVRSQVYENWELCISDDNSGSESLRSVLQEYANIDSRIKCVFRSDAGHISKATNSAAEMAQGEFLGFLDQDDELREHTLFMVVCELNASAAAEIVFSDEDKITDDGERHSPHFKSNWNRELMLGSNCVCHFTVVRASSFREVGGLRSLCDGAQDWDLILRLSERTTPDKIRHIPHILYHWRTLKSSTACQGAAKPYVTKAQVVAVSEHLKRKGERVAQVEALRDFPMLEVRFAKPDAPPLVTLIVTPPSDYRSLRLCVESLLRRTNYDRQEIIILQNQGCDSPTRSYLSRLVTSESRVKVVQDEGFSSPSCCKNLALKQAQGSVIGFIGSHVRITHGDWLSEMVAQVSREDVAVVGARIVDSKRHVRDAGAFLLDSLSSFFSQDRLQPRNRTYIYRSLLTQEVMAVFGECMLVRRSTLEEVKGLDEGAFPGVFAEIDLCLRIRKAGKRVVYTPYAEVRYDASAAKDEPSKGALHAGIYTLRERWAGIFNRDPFYNPNLDCAGALFELAFPTRARKPWTKIETRGSVA